MFELRSSVSKSVLKSSFVNNQMFDHFRDKYIILITILKHSWKIKKSHLRLPTARCKLPLVILANCGNRFFRIQLSIVPSLLSSANQKMVSYFSKLNVKTLTIRHDNIPGFEGVHAGFGPATHFHWAVEPVKLLQRCCMGREVFIRLWTDVHKCHFPSTVGDDLFQLLTRVEVVYRRSGNPRGEIKDVLERSFALELHLLFAFHVHNCWKPANAKVLSDIAVLGTVDSTHNHGQPSVGNLLSDLIPYWLWKQMCTN